MLGTLATIGRARNISHPLATARLMPSASREYIYIFLAGDSGTEPVPPTVRLGDSVLRAHRAGSVENRVALLSHTLQCH